MTGYNIASGIGLGAVLRAGSRRVLAPPFAAFDLDTVCDIPVSTEQAARIMAVLREAILNSIDHARPASVPGKILLSSACEPDGTIRIQVADHGVGLPEGFDATHDGGPGFRTMRWAGARSSCLGLAVGVRLPAPERSGQSS